MKIVINKFEFNSKKECYKYVQSILHKNELTDEDKIFMYHYFKQFNIEFENKFGNQDFNVIDRRKDEFNNTQFYLTHNDKAISICMNQKKDNNNELRMCMRHSITNDIINFKNNSELICVLCGSTNDIQIDHSNFFKNISQEFLKKTKITIPNKFHHSNIGSYSFCKCDKDFEKEWIDYHNKNAVLRVLCKKCNLKKENKP